MRHLSQQPSLIAMDVPDASTWVRDQLRSYWACRRESLRGAAYGPGARAPGGRLGCGLVWKDRPADLIPKWDKEQRPQPLWMQSLLLAVSNDIYH